MIGVPAAAGLLASLAVGLIAMRAQPTESLRPLPDRAGRALPPRLLGSRRTVAAGVTVLGFVLALLLGPGLTVVAGAVTAGVLASRRRRAASAGRAAIEAAMPDAIELLVMSLHAGYSPAQAIGRLAVDAPAAIRPAFAAVEQRLHRGSGFADALGELSTECGPCALALVNALSAAVRDGLPLAPVLDRLTDEAKSSRRRHGEAAARRLPVRLSFPLVVCTLPSFVLLAIAPAVLGALSTLRGSTP